MSKKMMDALLWRFLAVVGVLYFSVFFAGYFTLPPSKLHGFIIFELGTLPVGLFGLGIIINLRRRYLVEDNEAKKD